MNALLRVMQVIYSSWIISGDDKNTSGIPTGPGVFDYALRDLIEKGLFPAWVQENLHFVETTGGLTCLESAQIQRLATEAKITSDPNPSYTRSDIEVTKKVAQHWLARLEIEEDDAKEWGSALRAALEDAERTLEPSHS